MCRCKEPVTKAVKEKVSLFCHVPPEQVSHQSKKSLQYNQEPIQWNIHKLDAYVMSH